VFRRKTDLSKLEGNQAPATVEYKLLQWRQCLCGRAIEGLGHSAAGYQSAKERL